MCLSAVLDEIGFAIDFSVCLRMVSVYREYAVSSGGGRVFAERKLRMGRGERGLRKKIKYGFCVKNDVIRGVC